MGELIFISPCLAGRHYLAMARCVELMLLWGILVRHNLIRNSDVAANYMTCMEHGSELQGAQAFSLECWRRTL